MLSNNIIYWEVNVDIKDVNRTRAEQVVAVFHAGPSRVTVVPKVVTYSL